MVLGLALLAGCGGSGSSSDPGSTGSTIDPDPSAAGTLTFIHLNDLHAHLTPHADRVPNAPSGQPATDTKVVERGGIARIATLMQQIRAEAEYSVTMNIGDTFHGGVEAMFTLGNAIVGPVNALGIDVGVPGNWDFAFSPAVTIARFAEDPIFVDDSILPSLPYDVEQPNYPNIAANVSYADAENGEVFLHPTLIKDYGNIRVGFIGLTSDIVAHMYELLAIGFDFLQGETAYRELINAQAAALRRQGVHIVVVMSELGIHKDYRLAQIIEPGAVDVFFSAHTHEATFEPLTSASGALVVEAGNDGYLGRMDVSVSNGQITGFDWTLIEVDSSIAEDPAMAQLVDDARAPFLDPNTDLVSANPIIPQQLTQPIDTVVGHTEVALDRRHALESDFNNYYTDILRSRFGTDLAMTPGFRFDAVVAGPGDFVEDDITLSGDVTIEDVYRFFPVTYAAATANIRGARLRELLEEALTNVYSTTIFNHAGGWLPGFSGLQAQVDLAAPDGQRITALYDANGNEILDNDVLTVAGCVRPIESPGVLCSYDGFTGVSIATTPQGLAWTSIDLLIDALQNNEGPTAPRQDFQDSNVTPSWPQTPFVQPLEGVGP